MTVSVALVAFSFCLTGCPFLDDGDPEEPTSNERAEERPEEESEGEQPASDDETSGGETAGQSSDVCGYDPIASPAALPSAPCERGEVGLTESFSRRRGKPTEETRSFELETDSRVCLSIENGSSGADRVSAAWIYVDGDLVVGPDRFDQQVDHLRETLILAPGKHDLRVRLASKPGAQLDVTVKHAELSPGVDSSGTLLGEEGILEVTNVAIDHPMFSPNGDGYHDGALFNADNYPRRLPGDANHDFHLDWTWTIVDAESCQTVETQLSGTTQVNSPTNVQVQWDGRDASGELLSDGAYLYEYSVDLVRSDGAVIDSATARARGFVIDSTISEFDERLSSDSCDPAQDPYDCKCPEQTGEQGRCTFGWIPYLKTFEDPSGLDTSPFVTTHRDPESGQWEVVVDLREFNGGGLIPQHQGRYASLQQLQGYIAELTGVPPDPEQRQLFNFDYVQFGHSVPVGQDGMMEGFNHFLLDVITDARGKLIVGDQTIDLRQRLRSDETPLPVDLRLQEERRGEECGVNGNFDGDQTLRAKSCTKLRSANLDPGGTDLGIYSLQWRMFDIRVDGAGTERDVHCVINGIFKCGVRTRHQDASLTAAGKQFRAQEGAVELAREVETRNDQTPALIVHTDRYRAGEFSSPIDGVCSRSFAGVGSMRVPLDTATGSVAPACVINGIF